MKIFTKSFVVIVAIALAACSEGGSGRRAGVRCPLNYQPVNMKVDEKLQIEFKSAQLSKLAPGNYKYNGADIYYNDPANNAKIHMRDIKKSVKDNTFSPNIYCVRNYRAIQQMKTLSIRVSGVSDIEIQNSSKVSFEMKDYSIEIKNGLRQEKFSKSEAKLGSVEEVYEKADEVFMFETTKGTAYEIRSHYPATKDRGEIYLSIHLTRSDLAAPSSPATTSPDEPQDSAGTIGPL